MQSEIIKVPKRFKIIPKEWIHFYALIDLILTCAMFNNGRQLFPVPTENNNLAPADCIIHAYILQKTIHITKHFVTKHAYLLKNLQK